MENYRPHPPYGTLPENPEPVTSAPVANAGGLLRRLLPFPSSDASSLQTPLMQMGRNLIPQNMVPAAIAPAAGQQAATIVSEAASILDEEMARGVLAARGVSQFPGYRDATQSSTVLRQVHEVIDSAFTPNAIHFSAEYGARPNGVAPEPALATLRQWLGVRAREFTP